MRAFRKLYIWMLVLFLILAVMLNIVLIHQSKKINGQYRVEAKRLADEITETGSYELADYPHITGVYSGDELYKSDENYVIIEADGKLYRAEYTLGSNTEAVVTINLILGLIFLLMCLVYAYIWKNIIKPFGKLNDVPHELAKGNLAVPIPEQKSRFFGKFTWGVNLLREKIENDRQKDLSMQKDKKLLLLSLSHDIKTPLSAIKLNAKALAKGIYTDEEKRRSVAESINKRADEIEHFVSEITKAASEDFMNFEIAQGEVFLSQIIEKISARYAPQLSLSGTEFVVCKFDDCILSCDPDRLGECLQNLVENAIKYGDGRRIEIGFDKMDGCELISVTNTGCTLESKELPQIFGSFHRGNNAENIQGNGLGLFICKKLMSLMGGEVYAEIHDNCFSVTLVVKLA